MKKYGIILFFIFISSKAFSQDFNAGLRFGMDASQVNGDKLSGFDKLGLIGGGFVNRFFSDKFSAQLEIVWIQKGSRKPTDDYNSYYRMRLSYIEVPILIRYHTPKKWGFTLGPSFGTLIFSEENDEFGVLINTVPFEKFEFAGNAGFLYKMNDHWTFDCRYSQSLSTIRPFPGYSSDFFDKGQYNIVVELTMLYTIR